jgi:colanic acid biosynthesis glycosyl transferase WcaI
MTKLVFVNRYFFPDESATSQLLTDLTRALAEARFDVQVICSRQLYHDPNVRLPASEAIDGVRVHRIWTTRFGRHRLLGRAFDYATFYLSSAVAMLRFVRRGDTLIAETDPPLISIPAMFASKLKGAELINWLQDIFPEVATILGANPLPRWLDGALRRLRNASLKAARLNVVLGERMQRQLLRNGIPPDAIRIIANWAEGSEDPPKSVQESLLRAKLGLIDHFVVGYSGNLGRAHDFQTVLGAAEQLRKQMNIVFLMVGGGVGMTQLEKAVADRGLPNFRFLPYLPRHALADGLAAADVHWVSLLPALEGYIVPSKFYGILAAARPVVFIGDADGELAREIRTCGCGNNVQVGNSRAFTELLTAMQSDPVRRELMGVNGYRRYAEYYCARRAYERWAQLFKPQDRAGGV